jgi:glycosyltransferase involved in cell wall biosynthesis
MRILVVATEILLPDAHGGSTHVQELCEHLRAHGPTLLLCRRGSSGEGIAAIGRPMRRYPAALRHVDAVRNLPTALSVARQFAPDVIYERCTSYGLGAMLSMALDVPLLTMVLDQRYSWLSLLRASRLVATRLDIVPSPVRGKAVKVSWGANPVLFDAALPRNGVRGEERRALDDRFVFTGSVPYAEVPRLLAAADVCAAPFSPDAHGPSRKHGFTLDPLKVFEYLALGKPTITIRAPNIEALFADGEHLLLVEPADDRDLADAIARFMDDRDLAARTAKAGRERVLERHTWAAHAEQLATVFRAMMDERRAA